MYSCIQQIMVPHSYIQLLIYQLKINLKANSSDSYNCTETMHLHSLHVLLSKVGIFFVGSDGIWFACLCTVGKHFYYAAPDTVPAGSAALVFALQSRLV